MAQGVRPIDKEKFYKGLNEVLAGTKSMSKAAKEIGISLPTANKYFNMVVKGEQLPDGLFKED
nr:MAG TPA: HTH-type transcriptional regulator [Bacteriophage sp.]